MNKQTEKYLLYTCIAYVVGIALGAGLNDYMATIMESFSGMNGIKLLNTGRLLSTALIGIPVSIVCGMWLMNLAKENNRNSITWFLFGLAFQLVGVAIFYAVLIYEKLSSKPSLKSSE